MSLNSQKRLDTVMELLQINKLSLNRLKSKLLIPVFHMAQYHVGPPLLGTINIQIEHVTLFILCIILHENLKWEGYVIHSLNKISKLIGTISKLKKSCSFQRYSNILQ